MITMVQFVIEEKIADQILNYLAKQPYIEVADLIDELRKLKKKE